MILFTAIVAVLIVFWLRVCFYRSRFNRVLAVMSRGDAAQRATATFWKIVGLCLLIVVIRLFLEVHAR